MTNLFVGIQLNLIQSSYDYLINIIRNKKLLQMEKIEKCSHQWNPSCNLTTIKILGRPKKKKSMQVMLHSNCLEREVLPNHIT